MTIANPVTDHTMPSPSQIVARAEAMIPILRQRAGDADRNAHLAPETIRELRDAGFFRILQPPRFGGYGMRFQSLLSPMLETVRAFDDGRLRYYNDVIRMSK